MERRRAIGHVLRAQVPHTGADGSYRWFLNRARRAMLRAGLFAGPARSRTLTT